MLGDQRLIAHLENDVDNSTLIDVMNEAFAYCDKILKEVHSGIAENKKFNYRRKTINN